MDETMQPEKTPYQLGLPPMELAETSDRNSNGTKRCLLHPLLQKIIAVILIILCMAGAYIILSSLYLGSDSNSTQIMIVNKDSPNITIEQGNIEIFVHFKNKSEESLNRKKRDINETVPDDPVSLRDGVSDNTEDTTDDDVFSDTSVNIDEEKSVQDQSNNTLPSETPMNDFFGDSESHIEENTTSTIKRETTGVIANLETLKPTPNSPFEARDSYGYVPEPIVPIVPPPPLFPPPVVPHPPIPGPPPIADSCLLAKLLKQNYPHAFIDISGYSTPPHYENRILPYSRFVEPTHFQREADPPNNIMHHQDAEIMMNFLTPQPMERASSKNSSAREAACDMGSVPCANGQECILEKQWCDGRVDCSDISDESGCSCKSRVDKSRLCDGYFDCPFGEDEMGCYGCSESTFSCIDLDVNSQSTCFTKQQRCNHVADCPNQRDELDCTMLSPTLHKTALFAISNTEGFLHRNFRGDWYAVCKNPYMWAHDACRRETGLIIRPPFIQVLPIDPMLKVNYLNTGEGGMLQASNTCFNNSAIYVTCPDLLCGTRIMPATQILRENPEVENHLFGRNKRFLLNKHPHRVLFYTRHKKHIANATDTNNNTVNSLKTEYESEHLRYKRMQSRVVGGRPSEAAAWPWMVAMYKDGMFHCGGVVITQKWVMSAAHCMHKYWNNYFEIRVGMLRRFSFSPQEANHKVTHVIVNHKYNKEDMKNDISLLKVAPSIQFSRWVRPICLPGVETAGTDWLWGPPAGTMCTAVGWGATIEHGPDPDHLREVEVPIWPRCKHSEDREGKEICAGVNEGGRDACQGDSGGPLLCKNPRNPQQWYMAGIVSHGDGCGRKDEPGVYTRVSIFVKWIRHHIFSELLPSVRPKQECSGFKCVSGMAKCLPNKRVCDKIVDCLGGEDEINCNSMRSPHQFDNFLMSSQIEDNDHFMQTKEAEEKLNSSETLHETTQISKRTESDNSRENRDTTEKFTREKNSPETLQESDQISKIVESDNSQENRDAIEKFAKEKNNRGDMDDSISVAVVQNPLESRDFTIDNKSKLKEADINEDFNEEPITNKNTPSVTDRTDENEKSTVSGAEEKVTTEDIPLQDSEKKHSSQEFSDTAGPESKDLSFDLSDSSTSTPSEKNKEISNLHSQEDDINSKTLSILESNDIHDNNKDIFKANLTSAKIKKLLSLPKDYECRHIPQIISYNKRCDRKADCEDGTDEYSCTCSDYISRFDQHLLCNGVVDCADGQDETDCYTCPEDHFLCKRSQQCLPTNFVCDGNPHCLMGEDELECYALTNGENMAVDFNGAPKLSLQGFLTKKHNKDWHVVCDENLTTEQHETAANHICRYLGFSSANKFLVKHINIREDDILRSDSNEDARNRRNIESGIPVHFAFRKAESSARHVVIKEPQVLKEECVPNVTKTCMSLYVYCDHGLFTENFEFPNEILFNREANVKTHMWPWIAKVFVDGYYRCSGVLVDLSWVLVSHSCLWDTLLSHHVVTVVLGSPKTLSSSKGMYEQIFKVDVKKELYHTNTKADLLHLREPAEYSNFVKPMVVSSSVQEREPKVCIAIGQDENNNTIGIFLQETFENCGSHNRCFFRTQKENICLPGMKSQQQWAGIISCHTEQGWYPAASFVDSRGECGIGDRILGNEIGNLKNEIKNFAGRTIPDSTEMNSAAECDGVRCGRGRCIKLSNVCDGVPDCEDRNDEMEDACQKKKGLCDQEPYMAGCSCASDHLKCHNGKCINKKHFKDGRDDCGDGTDEPAHLSCAHYLVKVKPARLCDGILHCEDRSDEDPMFCKCFAKKGFKCKTPSDVDICVSFDVVCDGTNDCPNGEDEKTCLGMRAPMGTAYGTGQVMVQSHGVWHTKCYKSQNHTKLELEAICKELGFISGHAKHLDAPPNFTQTYNYTIDQFSKVVLNDNASVALRNTDEPLAKAVVNESNENCYPVYIECL